MNTFFEKCNSVLIDTLYFPEQKIKRNQSFFPFIALASCINIAFCHIVKAGYRYIRHGIYLLLSTKADKSLMTFSMFAQCNKVASRKGWIYYMKERRKKKEEEEEETEVRN